MLYVLRLRYSEEEPFSFFPFPPQKPTPPLALSIKDRLLIKRQALSPLLNLKAISRRRFKNNNKNPSPELQLGFRHLRLTALYT